MHGRLVLSPLPIFILKPQQLKHISPQLINLPISLPLDLLHE